jgi:hypothetical protein
VGPGAAQHPAGHLGHQRAPRGHAGAPRRDPAAGHVRVYRQRGRRVRPARALAYPVYRHLIYGRQGRTFDVRAAYAAIQQEGIALDSSSPTPGARAVVGWLVHLERHGYLDIERDLARPSAIVKITVRGDFETRPEPRIRTPDPGPILPLTPLVASAPVPPVTAPAETRLRSGRELRLSNDTGQDRKPQDAAAALHLIADVLGGRVIHSATSTETARLYPRVTCLRCGDPLDPALAEEGLHILC